MPCMIEKGAGITRLRFVGDLTAASVQPTYVTLAELLPLEGAFAIDATGVSDCDTAGAQLLFALCRALRAGQCRTAFDGLSETISQALQRIGLGLDTGQEGPLKGEASG